MLLTMVPILYVYIQFVYNNFLSQAFTSPQPGSMQPPMGPSKVHVRCFIIKQSLKLLSSILKNLLKQTKTVVISAPSKPMIILANITFFKVLS